MNSIESIRQAIRDIPDFPKPGILFKDITPVISDARLLRATVDGLMGFLEDIKPTKLAAIDARGFLFAGALCDRLDIGLIPIRKKGKLPYKTYDESYELEYGEATLSVHEDAFNPDDKVVLIDDLLATGGTAAASARLIERAGARVEAVLFVIELTFLNGREKLKGQNVQALISF